MFSASKDPEPTVDNKANNWPRDQQQTPQGKDAAAAAAVPGQQAGNKSRTRERKFENGDRYRGGWLNGLVSTLLK
jgi:hypothetical protein